MTNRTFTLLAALFAVTVTWPTLAETVTQLEDTLCAGQARHYEQLTRGKSEGAAVSADSVETFARKVSPRLMPSGLTEVADSWALPMDRAGAKIGRLEFRGANGSSHAFAVWATARMKRPLYWAAVGYPATANAGLADLDVFLKREITSSEVQRFVKATVTAVGTNVCVKGAFSGRVYALPFERTFVAFVDDDPFANWGHPCRYVFAKDDLSAFVVHHATEPMTIDLAGAAVEMKILENPSKDAETSVEKTRSAVNALLNTTPDSGRVACQNGDTSHSYAVLISGGYNSLNNHTRYWGDTATMYGLLTRRYGIPRGNIQVFMSDGTSTNVDISAQSSSHSFFPGRTSPLDLDGDGTDDVTGPATTSSLSTAFASLKAKLKATDQLFVFVTDHGDQDDLGNCVVCLWNSEEMSVSEFAALTDGIACPVVYALEFCYSGGFADALAGQGGTRVVATAASVETSSAWGRTSKVTGITSSQGLYYMDPWVYYFAGAAGGIFPSVSLSPWNDGGACASADTNGDTRVSIAEAALYAKTKIEADGYTETPDYRESSSGVGSGLYLVNGTPSFGSGNLAYLSVAGGTVVQSGSSTSLVCTAVLDDGTSRTVTPSWSVASGGGVATVSADGLVRAANGLTTNALVLVRANYAMGDRSRTGTLMMGVKSRPPGNDNFADAAELCGLSGELTATSVSATYETGEPLAKYVSTAKASVWWKWTAPTSGVVTVSTAGSDFDTVLGIYTGETVSSLVAVAQNDDSATSVRTSKCTFSCAQGTRYYIAVAGYGGATGSVKLGWEETVSRSVTVGDALDNDTLTFTTGGAAEWFGQTIVTHDGSDALQSGAISDGTNTWFQTTVTGKGTISFWWRTSCESNWDKLQLIVGGSAVRSISGISSSWTQVNYEISSGGTHVIQWRYSKDLSSSSGLDAGFVDQVVWTPSHTVTYAPGTDGTGSQQTVTKSGGVALTLKGVTFTRAGYTQTGWSKTDGGAKAYSLGGSYTTDADITLYPVWTANSAVFPYTVVGGVAKITKYDSAGKDVIIPSEIDGYPVTMLGDCLFHMSSITSVVIPETVTNIGVFAFAHCQNLTTIHIPAGVRQLGMKGYSSFGGNISQTSFTVAASNACFTAVNGVLFSKDMTELISYPAGKSGASYDIPGTVTGIYGSAFEGCRYLTSVTVPEGVSSLLYCAFSDSAKLASVGLPQSLKTIGFYTFQNCSSLKNLVIPSGVTSIGYNALEMSPTNLVLTSRCGGSYASAKWGANISNARIWVKASDYDYWTEYLGSGLSVVPEQCAVALDANGGSGGTSSVVATCGLRMPPIAAAPTREGHTFVGYFDQLSGGTQYYASDLEGTRVWDKTCSAATLHARWLVKTYNVIYRPGAYGSGYAYSATKTYGVALTLRGETYKRTGYAQTGWSTTDGGAQAFALGASYTVDADVALYPVWKAIDAGTALDNSDLTFTSGGASPWYGQVAQTHDGVDAMRSGAISDGGTSWLQTVVTGSGTLSFWWYVSSESGYDYLRFRVDGVVVKSVSGTSGSWTQVEYEISDGGSHTIQWCYSKDVSRYSGLDAGFVDQVVWTPRTDPQPKIKLNSTYVVVDLSAGSSATNYPVSQLDAVPPSGWTDEYKTQKLVLRRIDPGTFTMGCSVASSFALPQVRVTFTNSFYSGVFPITQRQWELVMGTRPSYFTNEVHYASRPVESVSWNHIRGSASSSDWPTSRGVTASSFMGVLRTKTGLEFDLPTEAQWEYACRAGTTNELNSGKSATQANLAEVGRCGTGSTPTVDASVDTASGTPKVGSYAPNNWGLYDMHGNIGEWCLDYYQVRSSYPTAAVTNPVGAASGTYRVVRGGSWYFSPGGCASHARTYTYASYCSKDTGGWSRGLRVFCSAGDTNSCAARLSAPTGVSAADGASTASVRISWNAVDDAVNYSVWRAATNNSAMAVKIATVTSTSYADANPGYYAVNYYWVKAENANGASEFSASDSGYRYKANTHLLKYDANGGSGTMADQIRPTSYASYLTKNTFTRGGYAFMGWATTPTGSRAFFNGSYTSVSTTVGAIVTLYAVWTPCDADGFVIESHVLKGWSPQGSTDIVIPNGVTGIASYSFKASSVTSVTLPASLTSLGVYSFNDCSQLTNVTFDAGLKKIDMWSFCGCSSLTGVFSVPEGVTEVGFGAFMSSGVQTLVFPTTLTKLGGQISLSSKLKDVWFRGDAPIVESSVYMYTSDALTNHVLVGSTGWTNETAALPTTWPVGSSSARSIVNYIGTPPKGTSSHLRVGLEPVEQFPYKLVNDEAVITNYVGTAADVVFPSTLDGHPVSGIGYIAFYYGTYPFVNVTISEGIRTIGHAAFGYSSKLETISLPSTLAALGDSEGSEFLACPKLRRIDVEEGNATYKSIDGVLYDKAGTTLIYCPASMNPGESFVVPQGVTRITEDAFCSSKFKSVTLPEGLTEIEDDVFWCSGVETVSIPVSVTRIGRWAFCYCYSLSELKLPAHLTEIGQYALVGSKLTELDIPADVKTIGQGALNSCSSLTNLTLRGRVATKYAADKWGSNLSNSKIWVKQADSDYWQAVFGTGFNILDPGVGSVQKISESSGATSYRVTLVTGGASFDVDESWFTKAGIDVSAGVSVSLMNGIGANGIPRYQSFLFGLEPESNVPAEEQLKATISFDSEGAPVVQCSPKRESSLVTYTTVGKESLGSANWSEVTEDNKSKMRFFRVKVEVK